MKKPHPATTPLHTRVQAGADLTIKIQTLETEAHALGFIIGAHALNRAKNVVGWQMAGDDRKASDVLGEPWPPRSGT